MWKLSIAVWLVILGAFSMVFDAIILGEIPSFAATNIAIGGVLYGAGSSMTGMFGGLGVASGVARIQGREGIIAYIVAFVSSIICIIVFRFIFHDFQIINGGVISCALGGLISGIIYMLLSRK